MSAQLKVNTEMFHGTVTVVKDTAGDYFISAATGTQSITPWKRWSKEIVHGLLSDCGEQVHLSFLEFEKSSTRKRWQHAVSVPMQSMQKRAIEVLPATRAMVS